MNHTLKLEEERMDALDLGMLHKRNPCTNMVEVDMEMYDNLLCK